MSSITKNYNSFHLIPSDSPLVRHLLMSWQPVLQLSFFSIIGGICARSNLLCHFNSVLPIGCFTQTTLALRHGLVDLQHPMVCRYLVKIWSKLTNKKLTWTKHSKKQIATNNEHPDIIFSILSFEYKRYV